MTLTFEYDLHRVMMNHDTRDLSQRLFGLNVIVQTDRQTDTPPDRLPYLDH